MPPVILRDSKTGASARILPEMGFNCFQFTAAIDGQLVEVLDAAEGFEDGTKKGSGSGVPLLFPFPNRIAGGRFTWEGREYVLPQNKHPNAIHGFCFDRPWRVVAQDESSATGEFRLSVDAPDRVALWPTDFILRVTYTISGPALQCRIVAQNPTTTPLPFGFGTHTYFKIPLSSSSAAGQCQMRVPAHETWVLNEGLPTGERRPVAGDLDLRAGRAIGNISLDDVLTKIESTDGKVETTLWDPAAGYLVTQSFPAEYREIVVFTPPHGRSVCMEPYTCVTDAIHLQAKEDVGWRTIPHDGKWESWFSIEVSRKTR